MDDSQGEFCRSEEERFVRQLEKRIGLLEAVLLGCKRGRERAEHRKSGESLLKSVEAVRASWERKAGSRSLDRLLSDCLERENYVDICEQRVNSVLLDVDWRKYEEVLERGEELRAYEPYINDRKFRECLERRGEVEGIWRDHVVQLEEVIRMEAEVCRALRFYGEVIQLLSRKFVFWDRVLSLAEREIASFDV